jgi:glutamate synthase (NADPH/NADH) large chain
MTGGRVAILGEVGRNFGAGMSGGIAYVYNPNDTFKDMVNPVMIDLDPMDEDAQAELKTFVSSHLQFTGSKVAQRILDNWNDEIKHFIKVMPKDFKRVLAERKA